MWVCVPVSVCSTPINSVVSVHITLSYNDIICYFLIERNISMFYQSVCIYVEYNIYQQQPDSIGQGVSEEEVEIWVGYSELPCVRLWQSGYLWKAEVNVCLRLQVTQQKNQSKKGSQYPINWTSFYG